MEVPRLGVESELLLPTYATATPDLSHICNLLHSLRQCWILNPLSETRDQTCTFTDTVLGSWSTEPQWELQKVVTLLLTMFCICTLHPRDLFILQLEVCTFYAPSSILSVPVPLWQLPVCSLYLWICFCFVFVHLLCFLFFIFCFFRAATTAYGSSQARGRIGAVAAGLCMPQPQECGIRALSSTYTTAHSNAGSLTHWARTGIEPTSSWILVQFVNHWATEGTPILFFRFHI